MKVNDISVLFSIQSMCLLRQIKGRVALHCGCFFLSKTHSVEDSNVVCFAYMNVARLA